MTLTLNEKEKRAVAALVQEQIDQHLSRFPYARYPLEPLEEWKRIFCDPDTVPITTLRQAIGWQFGCWQRKDLSSAHSRTIIDIVKAWPEFAKIPSFDSAQAFRFWEEKLPDLQHGYNAIAFLLHLMRPDKIEIADHHRIQAMLELLKGINHQESDRTFSHSLQDLELYTDFFRAVLPKLPYGSESRVKLDRFLKAFGNRQAYSNVKESYRSIEPQIRQFSWNDCAAEQYDLSKITLRSNADVLFACILLSLDKNRAEEATQTINQITERIPLGTAGICNPASYNYAMVALFGTQKGRDYFQFANSALMEIFTQQANQSSRDMQLYLKHLHEVVTINPKYRKQK